jgi:thiamine pyrophosphate-dependent acetolactate synthase large subunit-like protein
MDEVTRLAPAGSQLERRSAVATLLRDRGDMLVVTGLGSSTYDTFAAGDHDGNFYLWGAMGGAALTGLGLATARPDRPVAVITGDGEQLMGLGGLATISVRAPRNLSIVILDNGHYGETGGQLSHSGVGVDLAKVAAATGIAEVLDVRDARTLEMAAARIRRIGEGPFVAVIRIVHEETPRALPSRDGAWLKLRMRQHLGLPA